jgi:threonine aldolase
MRRMQLSDRARSATIDAEPLGGTIELRSDTMTSPTDTMYAALGDAPHLGDDAWGTDPVVQRLERRCAELFGKEAGLYTASGTMGNQLAVSSQLSPGDELITEYQYHVNFFESAATVTNSGAVLHPVISADGILRVDDVEAAISRKPRGRNYAMPRLLCLENTIGTIGGVVYPYNELMSLRSVAREHGMSVHLDGARIVNASIASGVTLAEYGQAADTISMCFSKGLSAPFGGILVGDEQTIDRARRKRKWIGGAFHQTGFTAAAAMIALDERSALVGDHEKARIFYSELSPMSDDRVRILEPETNIVLLEFPAPKLLSVDEFVEQAASVGVQLAAWRPGQARVVMHRNVSLEQASCAAQRLAAILS